MLCLLAIPHGTEEVALKDLEAASAARLDGQVQSLSERLTESEQGAASLGKLAKQQDARREEALARASRLFEELQDGRLGRVLHRLGHLLLRQELEGQHFEVTEERQRAREELGGWV